MLVHFVEPTVLEDYNGYDYDHTKLLSCRKVKDYDRFIKFIQRMVGHEVILNDEWYTIESYAFSFPNNNDYVPCLYVYVVEYF